VNSAGNPIANAAVRVRYEHRAIDEMDLQFRGDLRSGGKLIETNAAGEFSM